MNLHSSRELIRLLIHRGHAFNLPAIIACPIAPGAVVVNVEQPKFMPTSARRPNFQWVFLALAVLCLSACSAYRNDGTRTVGEFTDDVGIQAAVKTRLIRHPEIKGLKINVEVKRSVVSLYGDIASDALRETIVTLVAGVRGVAQVEDHLVVRPQ